MLNASYVVTTLITLYFIYNVASYASRKLRCPTIHTKRASRMSREAGKHGGIMFEVIIDDYAYLPGPLCLIKEARSALLCTRRTSLLEPFGRE